MNPEDILEDPETALTIAQLAIVGAVAFSVFYTIQDIVDYKFFRPKRFNKIAAKIYMEGYRDAHTFEDEMLEKIKETQSKNGAINQVWNLSNQN